MSEETEILFLKAKVADAQKRAEQAEQRVAELESKVRNMEPTYLWGAKVMNEIVLPRVIQIRKSELPADALSRWLREKAELEKDLERASEMWIDRYPDARILELFHEKRRLLACNDALLKVAEPFAFPPDGLLDQTGILNFYSDGLLKTITAGQFRALRDAVLAAQKEGGLQ